MLLLRRILILFIVILINSINSSTINIESTTIQSIYARAAAEFLRLEDEFKNGEEKLQIDRQKFEEEKKQMQMSMQNTDVIRLNVGGEIMMTTRETLTCIPKSLLSIMFNGQWEHKLNCDQNENIFLDFNPILFRHLLDQLQILDTNNPVQLYPPSQSSLIQPFKKMLQKLGFDQFLLLEKNILKFNVGGQIMTNQRRTFTQVSNSTFDTIVSPSKTTQFNNNTDVFLDYHPKLFQHLINQLREESSKNPSYLKAPSDQERISFEKMLIDLSIYGQEHFSMNMDNNTEWKQNAITIPGGNQTDQLCMLTDAISDEKNESIIICDRRNRRVVRWSGQKYTNRQTIISNIDCYGLTMDRNGNLYVSDYLNDEVRRWKIGETNGIIVAGGNGKGNQLNQFNSSRYIFIDQNHSIYVSDYYNHRVIKWMKNAKEGIVVAGGQGQGNSLTQLSYPEGVIVDQFGHLYVADSGNHRIMRWSKRSRLGSMVVGKNGMRKQLNQLKGPIGLLFDRQGHLYAVDYGNNRVQKI